MRCFPALFLCAFTLAAQQEVALEGNLLDASSGLPLAGITVALRYSNSPVPLDTMVTGATGAFHFSIREAGSYAVETSGAGYQDALHPGPGTGIDLDEAWFEPGAAKKIPAITLKLARTGLLSGMVRDAESARPLASITVVAMRESWFRGRRRLSETAVAFTDKDGIFRFDTLQPGQYVVQVKDRRFTATVPTAPAVTSKPKRYPILFLPGGGAESTATYSVTAGGSVDVGTIDYEKVLPAHIRWKIAGCPAKGGRLWTGVSDYRRTGGVLFRSDSAHESMVVCEAPGQRLLDPGRYRLKFLLQTTEGRMLVGAEEIEVAAGAESDVEMRPLDPPRISGRIVCDCEKEFRESLQQMGIRLSPFEDNDLSSDLKVREDATLAGEAYFSGDAELTISNLPVELQVAGLVYNGRDSGRIVPLVAGSAALLEIHVTDRLGSVSGTSSTGDRIVLANWPVQTSDRYSEYRSTMADFAGSFRFDNVPAGTYRVARVAAEAWNRREMPNAVAEWLSSGEELVVMMKQTATVRLQK